MKKKNLIRALSAFREDLWPTYEDSLGSISVEIDGGVIDKKGLEQELQIAVRNPEFDWIKLANESALFMSLENYSNIELREHVQNLLTLYIYPELKLTDGQSEIFEQTLVEVLNSNKDVNEGWVTSEKLLELVNEREPFLKAQSYHLWQVYLDKILYNKLNIERKVKDEKDRFIGYLKYKK
ncbi:hypothetical protein AB9P05_03975 [Roseivirga sp. BDSF3-8]|uniref:hypothetical protein n=1 Tax=Roseivirga sp. BDSF3-8 TaxID=3241598 RepID=UPI003531B1D8